MHRASPVAALLALAACSGGHGNDVDVNAAAEAAQADIDNYEAIVEATPSPRATPPVAAARIEGKPAEPVGDPEGTAQARKPRAERPVATAAASSEIVAVYACRNGPGFTARFDHVADAARIGMGGHMLATLAGQRPASGLWYKGEGYELRGKGRAATLTRPAGVALECVARG